MFTYLDDLEPVGEGRDVKHVQEGGIGHADPVALFDQVHVRDDLDGSLLDLGGDVKSL
jgi:hypothetical protein